MHEKRGITAMADTDSPLIPMKPEPRVPFNLRLGSLKSTRQTFARILRAYAAGTIDQDSFKAMVYGLGGFLAVFKAEVDGDFDDRLTAIEERQGL